MEPGDPLSHLSSRRLLSVQPLWILHFSVLPQFPHLYNGSVIVFTGPSCEGRASVGSLDSELGPRVSGRCMTSVPALDNNGNDNSQCDWITKR